MKRIYSIISIIVLCYLPSVFYGQTDIDKVSAYNWFDDVIGIKNIGLYNGKQYVDVYVNKTFKNTHPFFLTDKLTKGSVIYNKKNYYNVDLRYDVLGDELIIGLESDKGNRVLKLIKENIDQFTLADAVFYKVEGTDAKNDTISGFYQLLLKKKYFSLFKKHRKSKKDKIENNQYYYEFYDKAKYVVFKEGRYVDVKSKNDIIRMFPVYKKDIKKFYRTHKVIYKSDRDLFMVRLFDKLALSLHNE